MERSRFDNNVHVLHETQRGVDPDVLEDIGYHMIGEANPELSASDQAMLEALNHLEAAASLSGRTAKQRKEITQHRIQAKFKVAESLGLEPSIETDENGYGAVSVQGEEQENILYMEWARTNINYSNDDPSLAKKRQAEIQRLKSGAANRYSQAA